MTASITSPTSTTTCSECDGEGCRAYISRRGWRCEGATCETCGGLGAVCDVCDSPCRADEACGPCAERSLDEMGADIVCITRDPRTGLRIRCATPVETLAYITQECTPSHPAFRKPVRVDGMLIDEDTGPGVSHAGAGF